jgi:hypothetical protein|tara:strand:- start:5787 stop:6569 length:783 start_codon:yes stop_codon:yes gene_type:complete
MIIIPMVGRSRRFLDAGYPVPKYRLELEGLSVFSLAVGSFRLAAQTEAVVIVCLKEDRLSEFIKNEVNKIGMGRVEIVELDAMTKGQADTVHRAIEALRVPADESLTIFNVDTFRPDFSYPTVFDKNEAHGYLECFIGRGANWSNVVPALGSDYVVSRTSEKKNESQFCCTGLYYFRSLEAYCQAYSDEILRIERSQVSTQEIFVAPIYNNLISKGLEVRFNVVPLADVIFCGVPAEYEELKEKRPSNLRLHAQKMIASD